MSGLENRGGDGRGKADAWARASENGQVYQSGRDQHVTHIYITPEARGQAAHEARQRADGVVQVLTRTVGEWAARCAELEEQVERARAEGRAEAQTEFAGRLKDAELRVMRAQRVMREAEEARAQAEVHLAQAQQELALQRRAAERESTTSVPIPSSEVVGEDQETEQFAQLMEQAELQLGAVRDELRLLSDEVQSRGADDQPTVLVGEAVESGVTEEGAESATGGIEADGAASRPARRRSVRPRGEPRTLRARLVGVVGYFAIALPLPIAGSAIHLMYSAEKPPAVVWSVGFDVSVVVISLLISATLFVVLTQAQGWSDVAVFLAFVVHATAGVVLFVSATVMDPDTLPPLTAVGRFVAEYLGPL